MGNRLDRLTRFLDILNIMVISQQYQDRNWHKNVVWIKTTVKKVYVYVFVYKISLKRLKRDQIIVDSNPRYSQIDKYYLNKSHIWSAYSR